MTSVNITIINEQFLFCYVWFRFRRINAGTDHLDGVNSSMYYTIHRLIVLELSVSNFAIRTIRRSWLWFRLCSNLTLAATHQYSKYTCFFFFTVLRFARRLNYASFHQRRVVCACSCYYCLCSYSLTRIIEGLDTNHGIDDLRY